MKYAVAASEQVRQYGLVEAASDMASDDTMHARITRVDRAKSEA